MTSRRRLIVNVSYRRQLLSILGVILSVVQPVAARAQGVVDPRISEAHDLFVDHQVMESLQVFEDVVDEDPENYEALWGAARSAVAQGLLSRGTETQNQWFKIGESYARRSTEVEPGSLEGLYWLLSAKGLRATQTGGREAAALSQEVYDLAHQVLEVDSLHAGALHALGVVNYRVQSLSFFERLVARSFLGGDLMSLTNWEDAERYLRRALELEPESILFHLDLGRMYLNRNREGLARFFLRRAVELPLLEPPDVRLQRIAERRLAETFN